MTRSCWISPTTAVLTACSELRTRFTPAGGYVEVYECATSPNIAVVYAWLPQPTEPPDLWDLWSTLVGIYALPEDRVTDGMDTWRLGPGQREFLRAHNLTDDTPPDRGRGPSLDDFLDQQRRYGNMVGRRQTQAAAARRRRAEAAKQKPGFQIAWDNPDVWKTEEYTYTIREMEDGHLWKTVIWLVRGVISHYTANNRTPEHLPVELAAKRWLANRTVFRAMLQEGIRRNLSFPGDIYDYVKSYVLRDQPGTLPAYEPWRDPQAAAHTAGLAAFLDQPLEVEDFGKELRAIDLS